MKNIIINMYNGENEKNADKITIFFSDADAVYFGNIFKNDEIIGDYTASDSTEIEKAFPQLVFNWD